MLAIAGIERLIKVKKRAGQQTLSVGRQPAQTGQGQTYNFFTSGFGAATPERLTATAYRSGVALGSNHLAHNGKSRHGREVPHKTLKDGTGRAFLRAVSKEFLVFDSTKIVDRADGTRPSMKKIHELPIPYWWGSGQFGVESR